MKPAWRSSGLLMRTALGASIWLAAAALALGQGEGPSVKSVRQAQISPDGTHVAWIEPGAGGTGIYVQDLKAPFAQPQRITAAGAGSKADEGDASWSPNSKQLAFLSDAGGEGQSELYVVDVPGGTARRLTSLKGFLADPAWAPDGKTIAILFTENAPRAAGPLMPMTPEPRGPAMT